MNPLISDKLIEQLICHSHHPAHFKDERDKYIFSNAANDALFTTKNLQSIIGGTIWDLNAYMKPYWGNMASDISALESEVKLNQQVYFNRQKSFLNTQGLLVVQTVTKYPIVGINNKTIGVLSSGEIITNQLNLFELFNQYLQLYSDNYQARLYFLIHLGIDKKFYEFPTTQEIKVLIAKKIYHQTKLIANYLNIEIKTAESHLYKLKVKLKISLNELILSIK